MQNLTNSLLPFWLVLLTEHKVIHMQATHAVYCSTAAWLPDNVPVLWLLFSSLSMLPSFQPLAIYSALSVHHCFERYRFLIRIASSCEIFMILFNFC